MAEWFIKLNGKTRGPFSIAELKAIKGLTPDTLAWKEGMARWLPIRKIPELMSLFEEEEVTPVEELPIKGVGTNGVALTVPQIEPPQLFWLIFFLVIIFYAFYQIYFS